MTDEAFKVSDLSLPEWSTTELVVAGYQVVQAAAMTVGRDIRLGDVRVLILKGSVGYFTARGWEIREIDDDNFEFHLGPIEQVTAPPGVYMLIITPNDGHGNERIQVAAPLAAAILGGSVIYRELYTNIYSTAGAGTQVKGPALGPPKNFPVPTIDTDSVMRYKIAYQAIGAASDRARIQLSLRWFEEAHHTFNEDALLRYWFAIETLAMPNTTNIRPANELLARTYGIPISDIQTEIELGRIQGLRSDIAHNGLMATLDPRLLNFVAAVYVDILEATLGLTCQRRARSQKVTIGSSIASLVPHP